MAGFEQVHVHRKLDFLGSASYQGNTGLIIPTRKIFDETFFTDADEHDWTENTAGCTIDHASVDGGATTITGDNTAAQDCGEIVGIAQWSAAYNCGMLAKVKISQITETCITIGFVDQGENTNDHVAGEIDAAALRDMSTTQDWCGFTFDTDQTTDVWYVGASEATTEGTPVAADGSLAPVADTYFYVVVQTDTSGNVTFYYGTKIDRLVAVGYLPDAIAAASSNLLAPYVGFITHAKGAQVCTISRVITWQDN